MKPKRRVRPPYNRISKEKKELFEKAVKQLKEKKETKKYNCCSACPKCGSSDIDVMDDDRWGAEMFLKCYCLSCACHFTETFLYDNTQISRKVENE